MPGYIKDEINFHGFMTMMRQMHNVTLEQVCDGLCTVSMMNRIESGQRLPDKLTRDRIMLRLGVAMEGYEDYLTQEEYEEWKLRQKIVKCLDHKDHGHTKKYLDEYCSRKECSKVELQFCEAVYFMMLKQENASINLQLETIERAVKFTMPMLSPKHLGRILLSEQELNLLTEYLWLYAKINDEQDRIGLCINRYEDILSYIGSSLMDANGRAKTYPQAAYYLCRLILESADTQENIQKGMKSCHQAIEILRNAKKAYYFIELLEVWQELAHRWMHKLQGEGRSAAAKALESDNEKKREWEKLLRELYQEYEVPMYMENFCYLYQETRSYCISDVIRTRRKMLGLTKEQLSEGICSVKTLTRIELKKAKTQMPIVRELFERLGLYAEYTRERVITNDYETLKLADRLAGYINNEKMQEWEDSLRKLEKELCMEIPQNRQFIHSTDILLKYKQNRLPKQEFMEKHLEILEYTLPLKAALKEGKRFLSREEAHNIYVVGMYMDTETARPYMKIIEELCDCYRQEGGIRSYIIDYEFFTTGLCSYLGNIGQYNCSNELSLELLKYSLSCRRLGLVANNIYNLFWNKEQTEPSKKDNSNEINKLHHCILLSRILQNENSERFYRNKLNFYFNGKL